MILQENKTFSTTVESTPSGISISKEGENIIIKANDITLKCKKNEIEPEMRTLVQVIMKNVKSDTTVTLPDTITDLYSMISEQANPGTEKPDFYNSPFIFL